ncbi:MAG: DUF255 domain-containing protein [Bdellovibrionota bacterium]
MKKPIIIILISVSLLMLILAGKIYLNTSPTINLQKNNLQKSNSPYLKSLRESPINWQIWDQGLLTTALSQNKLIFISIGYSSCHWCQVMGRESFLSPQVANILNKKYIAIKIDREENPELDQLFTAKVEEIGLSGGWPLNIWLEPNGLPIFATNYIEKDRLIELSKEIVESWENNPEKFSNKNNFKEIKSKLKEGTAGFSTNKTNELSNLFIDTFIEREERIERRLLIPPRFPRSEELTFLMSANLLPEKAKFFLKNTLLEMSTRGLYDPIDGGFFRYTTDPSWKNPHFEKTLYVNALLVKLYAKASVMFPEENFINVAINTLKFLDEKLIDSNGSYYASLSAESMESSTSKPVDGLYYTLNKEELNELTTSFHSLSDFFSIYPLSGRKNLSILHQYQKNPPSQKLLDFIKNIRKKKASPQIDKKVITAWNALSSSALTELYKKTFDINYLKGAEKIITNILKNNYKREVLYRYSIAGKTSIKATTNDYALLIKSLLDLYQITFNVKWLEWAQQLQKNFDKKYWQKDTKLYVAEDIIGLDWNLIDFAKDEDIPPGNVVAAACNYLLYAITTEDSYKEKASASIQKLAQIRQHPIYYPSLIEQLRLHSQQMIEIVISAKDIKVPSILPLLQYIYQQESTPITVIWNNDSFNKKYKAHVSKARINNNDTFYACTENKCLPPTSSPNLAIAQIKRMRKEASKR